MVKVSIIVPVYNVEKYLDKCLSSLVNQTLNDIEIIVVNDGSPDNSNVIIEKFKKEYPSIIKAFNKENGGLGDARNYGVLKARGEYIGFVDSDDYVEKDMFKKLYDVAQKHNSDLVVCGYNIVNEKSKIMEVMPPVNTNINTDGRIQVFLSDNAAWNKLYKKEIIVKNNLTFRSKIWYEDLDFKIKYLSNISKINIINDPLYNYVIRDGSIMNNNNILKNEELLWAFDSAIDYLKEINEYDKYYDELEYLAICHIYISGLSRIISISGNLDDKKKVQKNFLKYMNKNFKNFKNNKYLKFLTANQRIIFNLLNIKLYKIIKVLLKIKGVVKR